MTIETPAAPAEPYRFSDAELGSRLAAVREVMDRAGVGAAVLYGANRSGAAIPWLTDWPVTREAHLVITKEAPPTLLINYFNHVPHAQRTARNCEVRWAGADPIASVLELLPPGAVGLLGALPPDQYRRLAAAHSVTPLDREHTRLRQRKSAEEVQALRQAAALTDLAAAALLQPTTIGLTEHEAIALIESAYVSRGGGHHIHYLGVTSMAAPDRCVPAQWPSPRRIEVGDLLTFELSASSAPEYPGQLLRSAAVGADAAPLVLELHAAADAAFAAVFAALGPGVAPAELVEAARVIEDAGFTTLDDLVHGFGGGYLPPIAGSTSRTLAPVPTQPIEAGMTLVIQPNVVLPDHSLGVQTGELILVTDSGAQRLQTFPPGLQRIRV